ncbi:MAG: insulinase family protein [Acidobacteria bacterium]|nr:insulinase family protein [Acidobacteriota bacterium]
MLKLVLGLLCSALAIASQDAPKIENIAQEFQLENGMRWVVIRKPGLSTISAGWVAHVGSANERPGITGISHLFEHMMFKGSDKIGVKDAAKDRELRQKLDTVREEMFEEERTMRQKVRNGYADSINDPALESERMKALKTQFQKLIEEQRENLVKDEFDKIYTGEGGVRMNAFTNEDMTVYFISVPKNKLELWFWMESERLSAPVFREFYSERDVVYEERRMRTDSTPTGKQEEAFENLFWANSTYSWPVVGWPSDISAITRSQAEAYFDIFYAPNNLTACIVGDVTVEQVKAFAQQYFNRIPRGETAPPDVVTLPIEQYGVKSFVAEVDSSPEAEIRYRTTAFNGLDAPALDVLSEILSGQSGRLNKRLVLDDQIATEAGARFDGRKYDGSFSLFATGKNETDPAQLEVALHEELQKIQKDGITAEELTRVKNNLQGQSYRRMANPFWLMVSVLVADGYTYDWRNIDRYQERINQVTTQDVRRVAEKYLVDEKANYKRFSRKSDSVEEADLANLTPQQKEMVTRAWGQISQAPADKLPQIVEQIQNSASQAPPEMKPALDVLLDRINAKMSQGGAQ